KLVGGEAFGLQEHLVRSLVRKSVDFVLDGRAITRANPFDHPRVHGRTIQAAAYDLVRAFGRMGIPARQLRRMHAGGPHVRGPRPPRMSSCVRSLVWVIQHGSCFGCMLACPMYENTGTGSRSPGCSSNTLKSMVRPSMRGGVPVFSRPCPSSSSCRRLANDMAG